MHKLWKETLFLFTFGILAPAVIVGVALQKPKTEAEQPDATTCSETQLKPEQNTMVIHVLHSDGNTVEMEMNSYLTGVLLQEMPADFEPDAKRAQAVVARTYALRRNTGAPKHEDNAVCTDAGCCQAYISEDEYLANGGSMQAVESARDAVEQTGNQVLLYDGELIEATYFSCSGGRTEDAVAVWGSDVPYLQAVDSPGEEDAVHYSDFVTFSPVEFASAMGLPLSGDPTLWFGEVTYTNGGGVDTMVIGGLTYQGTSLRQMLGLRSTNFSVSTEDEVITITSYGFGHRVGMSQYGAEAMAVLGSSYKEILSHYYPGTVLADWIDKEGALG